MEFMIAVWIISGITCGVIAASKNRNPIGWAALGFIGTIFALIAVAAMPALPSRD
jgi:uncharacterized membrane protein HdeD (DUF308 family)